MNDFNTRMKGYIFVIIATSLYGIMPAVASFGYMRGLNSYSLFFGRVAFSVPIYIMMAIYKKESFRITGKQLVWILCMSVFGTANGILAYMSYTYLPSGIASLMAMMYIVFTMLLEFLLRIEKVKTYKIMVLIMSFVGIFIILWTPAGESGISIIGILLGLAGSLVYSCQVIMINNERVKSIPLEILFSYESLPSLLVAPIIASIMGMAPIPQGLVQWGWSALSAILFSVFAMLLFNTAVRLLGAGNASLVGTAEPFVSSIAGAVLLGDVLTGRSIAGGLIIFFSIFILTMLEYKKQKF